jgi:hypothetical protein
MAQLSCNEAKQHLEALRREIRRHNYLYCVKNQPEISSVKMLTERQFVGLLRQAGTEG